MARRKQGIVSRLNAPFLKRAVFTKPEGPATAYPFYLPLFARGGFEIAFEKRVTIFCGENGSGKSTLLEAIAGKCGFNLRSGNRDHALGAEAAHTPFDAHVKLHWLPKVAHGFFFRAESVTDFNLMIDRDPAIWASYGDRSPEQRSHGEGALSVMKARFERGGVFILDEPESALSPVRQAALVGLMHRHARGGQCQFIVATHSPIVLSCPGAQVCEIKNGRFAPCAPSETEAYRLYVEFFHNPRAFIEGVTDGQMDFLDDL
ncbi:MAG: AAA family ATPase [Alphaproteobacteria bacterium]|nr:AAA family ATPase [Alphaproteobacteria bacterium]